MTVILEISCIEDIDENRQPEGNRSTSYVSCAQVCLQSQYIKLAHRSTSALARGESLLVPKIPTHNYREALLDGKTFNGLDWLAVLVIPSAVFEGQET